MKHDSGNNTSQEQSTTRVVSVLGGFSCWLNIHRDKMPLGVHVHVLFLPTNYVCNTHREILLVSYHTKLLAMKYCISPDQKK